MKSQQFRYYGVLIRLYYMFPFISYSYFIKLGWNIVKINFYTSNFLQNLISQETEYINIFVKFILICHFLNVSHIMNSNKVSHTSRRSIGETLSKLKKIYLTNVEIIVVYTYMLVHCSEKKHFLFILSALFIYPSYSYSIYSY